jgi:hypothetical protein
MDALRSDFRNSFVQARPIAQKMGRRDLFTLLLQLDPEYGAELFAPEDDEMQSVFDTWGQHVYAPGADEDEGECVELPEDADPDGDDSEGEQQPCV